MDFATAGSTRAVLTRLRVPNFPKRSTPYISDMRGRASVTSISRMSPRIPRSCSATVSVQRAVLIRLVGSSEVGRYKN
jgi:hypothetical protein